MLIGGPNGVFICNDCVSLAADGLEQSGIALSPVVETDRRDLGVGELRVNAQSSVATKR